MNVMYSDIIIKFFASILIYLLFAGLFVLWIVDGKIKKEQVVHAVFAFFVAFAISELIKHLFPTVRPYLVNGGGTDVFINPVDGAFPSSHTAEAFAIAVTVFLHDRRVGWWFLGAALSIGIARVLANVHYPVDIVGGAFLGTLVAVLVERTHFAEIVSRFSAKRKKRGG